METTIALLTPPGIAAIATLAVRGPLAWEITRELFRPRKGELPGALAVGRHWFGKLGTNHSDEVIVAAKENCLEIHCHGGTEVVRMIEEVYVERGAKVISWRQFADEPVLDLLAHAPTTRTASILLDQCHGAWQTVGNDPSPEKLGRLRELVPVGQHLVDPWKVVIAGAPNVGKSSLMNALAGCARSIVSPIAGTTRDVVTMQAVIDGWPVELIDTAGIRQSESNLEEEGIQRAEEAGRTADLCLWLFDGSAQPACPEDRTGWHFVINKIDLPAAWDWVSVPDANQVSAQTGAGIVELCERISRTLVPTPPAPGEAVPCLPEHLQWIEAQG